MLLCRPAFPCEAFQATIPIWSKLTPFITCGWARGKILWAAFSWMWYSTMLTFGTTAGRAGCKPCACDCTTGVLRSAWTVHASMNSDTRTIYVFCFQGAPPKNKSIHMCIYRLIAVVSRPSVYTHRILRLAEALCGCHHVRLSTGFFKSLEQPCWTGFCGSLASRVWTAIHKNMYQDACI